ncbi:MAG: glycosyltransferase family protein, partial [Planctomycetota bacterium]
MARIIYAVAGEGYGHSSRAHLIGQRLIEADHEVMFVASQKALQYLRRIYGSQVKEIFGLSFAYRRGRIDGAETFVRNLARLARANAHNKRLFHQAYRSFRPDLVITDFEPFTGWWAWRHRVPFISLDNEHLLTVCRLEHRLRHSLSRLTATAITKGFGIGAHTYVVTNFFDAPLKGNRAVLAPPVVRPIVTTLEPSNEGHVVVYWTTGTEERRLRAVLQKFSDQAFYIYGFNKSARMGNCLFKRPSTEGFLGDLASARGVIASAGLSLISECMYWRKRMLLLPLPGQY